MRHEFSKPTKREALRRSGQLCEAIGAHYGLEPSTRCNAPLSYGVEYDHYPVPATEKGSDTLDNCMAVCIKCHKWKTAHFDIPIQAKTKRVSDKHNGIRKPSTFPRRPKTKAEPQRKATAPLSDKFQIFRRETP